MTDYKKLCEDLKRLSRGVNTCDGNSTVIDMVICELQKLSAYEDTGLEPEEIEAMKNAMAGKAFAEIKELNGVSIDRLCEIAYAEQQGRLVVLPCKVGDTLYRIDYRLKKCTPRGKYGDSKYVCEAVGCYCHGTSACDFGKVYHIEELKNATLQTIVCNMDMLGKAVFLTREEAEAALERSKHD